jgi:hypothetical protein
MSDFHVYRPTTAAQKKKEDTPSKLARQARPLMGELRLQQIEVTVRADAQ